MIIEKEIHVGDVGTHLVVVFTSGSLPEPVDTATTKEIWLEKPNGTTVSKTAAFVTDGTDGQIEYITIAGDIDQAGTWKIQGYVEMAGGGIFHSKKGTFIVWDNIQIV